MLELVLTIDLIESGFAPSDTVDVFSNVNGVGNVPALPSWGETPWGTYVWGESGVDETRPVNDSPLSLFPGIEAPPLWGNTPWGEGSWGSSVPFVTHSWGETGWGEDAWCDIADDADIIFTTSAVHFGRAKFALKSRDTAGNYQSGAVQVAERVVNSTPLPPRRFERSTYSGGQQSFTFGQSAQLEKRE